LTAWTITASLQGRISFACPFKKKHNPGANQAVFWRFDETGPQNGPFQAVAKIDHPHPFSSRLAGRRESCEFFHRLNAVT
jgi:hypothetical protein